MTDAPARPIRFGDTFVDAAGAREWLDTLPLTNLSRAAGAIRGQLETLRAAPIVPRERLRIAETLREPIAFLHGELARRFGGKPVPHGEREQEAAADAIALWQALWAQYSQCLKVLMEGDASVEALAPAVLQRALFAGKQQVLAHGLARRQLSPTFWGELHAFYRFAEILECTQAAVRDPMMAGAEGISCYSAYAHALLLALADPYALSVRELELTDRWLAMWARKVNPSTLPPVDPGALLAVDLEGTGGFAVLSSAPATVTPSLRFAGTSKLSQSLRGRVKRLLEGESPASLKLGDDCVAESCVPLLKHLFARWCLVPRRLYADAVETGVELCGGGMEAMHFRLTGRTLARPETRDRLTFAEAQRMSVRDVLPGYDAGRDDAERKWPWERWQGVVAVTDAMLARSQPAAHRWQLGQVVACREADEIRFAHVAWIAEDPPHAEDPPSMSIRLAFWPGKIEPALLSPSDELLKKEPPFPAFYLRGDGDAAGTLVVPLRMFSPGRRLHPAPGAGGGGVRLTRLLQRGADFERVAFEPA